MAKSRKSSNAEFRQYVRISIAAEEASIIEAWLPSLDVDAELQQLTKSGFVIRYEWSKDFGYTAILYCQEPSHPDGGLGMSASSITPGLALACLFYKFIVKADRSLTGALKPEDEVKTQRMFW